MQNNTVIAIDGPAASGKSTVAQRIAARLHYLYFDTGVMYRAATLAALQKHVEIEDQEGVEAIAEEVQIDVTPPSIDDGRQYDVRLNGEDVTWQIRAHEVEANVSAVSTYPGVRTAMTTRQREIGHGGRVVMVGRDIGTVVMPDANLKFYLDASMEERARRRQLECEKRGIESKYDTILASMRERDRIDSTREIAPLLQAEDAIYMDTSRLTIEDVVEKVLTYIR